MKFRIIASIVVIVVLIIVSILIGSRQSVDADGNPVTQEQPQQ